MSISRGDTGPAGSASKLYFFPPTSSSVAEREDHGEESMGSLNNLKNQSLQKCIV